MSYHDLALSIGWLAVFINLWGTIAQFRRSLTRIEGVSLATWTLFSLMGLFWITYGIDRHSAIIILGSLTVLPFQLAIVTRLRPWRSRHSLLIVARSVGFSLVACVLPTLAWGWPGGIYGTGIAMVMNRAPQIVELIRDPDVSGVSTTTWTMIATGGVCWMVFYENARLWAAFASTSCACVASITIALLALWRHSNAGASRSAQQSVLTQF